MKILYAFPTASRYDRHDYRREIASIDNALAHARTDLKAQLETIELRSLVCLRRALLRNTHDIVVLAGHGPSFGLFEAATPEHRRRYAAVFAEELIMCCAANACVLLMGCSSSWMMPALCKRGLRGASFDQPIPAAAVRVFIGAFFDVVCAGRPVEAAFEFGCVAMAYDYPAVCAWVRWFGPELDPQCGQHHRWLVTPEGVEDAR
jgi:hypothetical protein